MYDHLIHPRLLNQTCAVLRRCSTPEQEDTSIKNQLLNVERCINANKMKVVHEIDLPGVTGSIPGNRWDINDFIQHKEKKADFKFLLLPSVDRFTRAGGRHGEVLLWNLELAGIVVHFVADGLFSDVKRDKDRIHDLLKAAHETVNTNARASAEGVIRSFLSDKCPYAHRPPIGLDRKIFSADGKPLYVIRTLRNGTQVMLHHKTGKLIRRFGLHPETGKPIKFKKHKTDRVMLVLGSPEDRAIVARVMELVWVKKFKYRAVARMLNDDEVPTRTGKTWMGTTVVQIATRSIYIGAGYRGQRKAGVYYEQTANGPIEANVSITDLARLKHAPMKRKPCKAWLKKDYPHLRNFLPKRVRDAARIGIQRELDRRAPGTPLVANKNRHKSNYLLSGRLRTLTGDHIMTGTSVQGTRYYHHARSNNHPKSNDKNSPFVPANPLEAAMLSIFRDVLLSNPTLRQLMTKAVKAATAQSKTSDSPAQLERRLMVARVRQADLSARRTGDDKLDAPFLAKLAKVDAEVAALMAAQAKRPTGLRGKPDQVVSALMKEFAKFGSGIGKKECGGDGLDSDDCRGIGAMLDFFIQRLVVDPTTRNAEIDIAVPDWINTAFLFAHHVSVETLFELTMLHHKTPKNGHILLSAKLTYDWKDRKYDIEVKKPAA